MPFYDVPAHEWKRFCDAFKRDHEGEKVSLAVVRRSREEAGGAIREVNSEQELIAEGVRLKAVDVEQKDGVPQRVSFTLKRPGGGKVVHGVIRPSRLWLEQPEGRGGVLGVESDRGEAACLQFERELIPAMLDGLA